MEYAVYPIEYNHIFEEIPLPTSEYLFNLNKDDLILMTLHIVGINNRDSFSLDSSNFLRMFFQDFPNSSNLEYIKQKINILKAKENILNIPNVILTFAEPRAALLLLKDIILLPKGNKDVKTEDDYLRFLKAYLVIVGQVQTYKRNLLKSIPDFENPFCKDARIHFINGLLHLGLADYNFYDILVTQQMKTLMLNEFISSKPELNHVVESFYKEKSINSILDNLINLLIVKVYEENKFKEGQISICRQDYTKHEDMFNRIAKYFDNICIDANQLPESKEKLQDLNDFSCYKQYPVLKLNDDHYVIISQYFFTLNIYNGLHLNLRQISQKVNEKDVRRLITSEFSEQYLFYKIIDRLLFNSKNVNISGKVFDQLNDKGRPDYYIRNRKRILLFEYKDILMNRETRNTSDFSLIEDFFSTRLNEKKGIPQIIKNIRDILNQNFKLDKGYSAGNIQIYPILITQDRLFSIDGTNYILNDLFSQKIEKETILEQHKHQIKPLIVIDIDFLLILSMQLKNNLQLFLRLIHSYYTYCEINEKFISFRSYILNNKKINLNKIKRKELTKHYFHK